MCLGIAHVSGKVPLPGQGVWQIHIVSAPFLPTDCLGRKGQIQCVSARPLVLGEGLYQIHGQSLDTHQGKHRSGGAQEWPKSGVQVANFLSLAVKNQGVSEYGWKSDW